MNFSASKSCMPLKHVRKNMRKQKTVRLTQTQIYLPIIFNIPLRIVNKKLGKVLTFKKP